MSIHSTGPHWVPAVHGHELALDGSTLICRKSGSGQILKSVPRAARSSRVGERLIELRERLLRHEEECRATVESWMSAGVPIPAALLGRVWPDPAWRDRLKHLAVTVGGVTGLLTDVADDGRTTLLEFGDGGVDAQDGGVDTGDEAGVTRTLPAGPLSLPHPVLLADAARWWKLLEIAELTQGIEQLEREVHHRPATADLRATSVDDYAGSHFEELRHATSRAAQHGFVMRGGFASLAVADGGVGLQARYWLGSYDPGLPTETGRLLWVDGSERAVALGDVGPVAWSEGVRMAALIHAGGTTHDH
ncbi:DUF4132 domain-containing protein [Streptomyces sp. NBC_01506]|uniref:DUF4132 domain-containing protein n=1 Tax=Streptomyces sp. NBC_01506 TaxID=2903887 RepID=UPI0038669F73